METVMVPTVGRNVYFSSKDGAFSNDGLKIERFDAQPCLAFVVYVHNDKMVNLVVHDHGGTGHRLRSVPFVGADDVPPADGGYAYWMPFQIGRARADAAAQNQVPSSPGGYIGLPVRVIDDANTGISPSDVGSVLGVSESVGQPLSGAPVIEGRPA